MYAKLYRHRDEFVVIDGVDALYSDRSGVRLLKCLSARPRRRKPWPGIQTPEAWRSRAFRGSSSKKAALIIISNDWKTLNKNVAALQDRGHVLMFEPDAAKVHRKAGMWFDAAAIYEWFAKNLHRVRHPSLRHYVRAKELKAAGMDWTDVLAAEAENKRSRLAAELLASAAHGSTAERVKAFVERGGGCRATFFNYCRYLLK